MTSNENEVYVEDDAIKINWELVPEGYDYVCFVNFSNRIRMVEGYDFWAVTTPIKSPANPEELPCHRIFLGPVITASRNDNLSCDGTLRCRTRDIKGPLKRHNVDTLTVEDRVSIIDYVMRFADAVVPNDLSKQTQQCIISRCNKWKMVSAIDIFNYIVKPKLSRYGYMTLLKGASESTAVFEIISNTSHKKPMAILKSEIKDSDEEEYRDWAENGRVVQSEYFTNFISDNNEIIAERFEADRQNILSAISRVLEEKGGQKDFRILVHKCHNIPADIITKGVTIPLLKSYKDDGIDIEFKAVYYGEDESWVDVIPSVNEVDKIVSRLDDDHDTSRALPIINIRDYLGFEDIEDDNINFLLFINKINKKILKAHRKGKHKTAIKIKESFDPLSITDLMNELSETGYDVCVEWHTTTNNILKINWDSI